MARVQATVEVQLAARHVHVENRRLRQLLDELGVERAVVERWASTDDAKCEGDVGPTPTNLQLKRPAPAPMLNSGDATTSPGSRDEPGKETEEKEGDRCSKRPCISNVPTDPRETSPILQLPSFPESLDAGSHKDPEISQTPRSPCIGNGSCPTKFPNGESSSSTPAPAIIPPCQLRAQLQANPGVDLRQLVSHRSPENEDEHVVSKSRVQNPLPGGVSCRQAYEMVIKYAASDAKLDEMIDRLQAGCVKDPGTDTSNDSGNHGGDDAAAAGGGCQVRNETLWEILDRTCI